MPGSLPLPKHTHIIVTTESTPSELYTDSPGLLVRILHTILTCPSTHMRIKCSCPAWLLRLSLPLEPVNFYLSHHMRERQPQTRCHGGQSCKEASPPIHPLQLPHPAVPWPQVSCCFQVQMRAGVGVASSWASAKTTERTPSLSV